MCKEVKPHTAFLTYEGAVATEAPIDFLCEKDLDYFGVTHKAGTSSLLMMAESYHVSANIKFKYVSVYSIYHPAIGCNDTKLHFHHV